jgi:hypothetical protein
MDRIADFLNRVVTRKPVEDPEPDPADEMPTEADRRDFEDWLDSLDPEPYPDRETHDGLIPMEIASTLCFGHE